MNMTHPDIQNAERFGMPAARRPEPLYCRSCDRLIQEEQRDQCAICHQPGCTGQGGCLIEIDEKYYCENCAEIAVTAVQQAARRCKRTPTFTNLKRFIKAMRDSA